MMTDYESAVDSRSTNAGCVAPHLDVYRLWKIYFEDLAPGIGRKREKHSARHAQAPPRQRELFLYISSIDGGSFAHII